MLLIDVVLIDVVLIDVVLIDVVLIDVVLIDVVLVAVPEASTQIFFRQESTQTINKFRRSSIKMA